MGQETPDGMVLQRGRISHGQNTCASKAALDSLSWCEVCAIVISFGENERPCTRIHGMQRNNAEGHATVTQRIVPVLAYEWLQLQPPLNPRGVINFMTIKLVRCR